MKSFVALLSGLLFGTGLLLSGMADPAKVINFLDLFGTWDPSLALVMGGAVLIALPGFTLLRHRRAPVLGGAMSWPVKTRPDRRLLGGAALFGAGWGLGGFCPGPAIVALPMASPGALIFVPAMVLGMWLARRLAS